MTDELGLLRARLARLEAKDACQRTLTAYLHCLDGEFTEDLLTLFAPEANLEIMNYPPGTGKNLRCHGHDEIRPIFVEHQGILTRHHASNVAINVQEDGNAAELSAYFLTAINFGLSGGIYEATLEPHQDRWLFTWMRISSNWGWIIPQEYPPILTDPLGAGTLRGGRPVSFHPEFADKK